MKNAAYWNTVNEGGEGYVKQAPAVRSNDEIEFDLMDAERDLKSAKANAAYKDGQDGTAYKVECLEKQVAALKSELGIVEVLPAVEVAIVAVVVAATSIQQKAVVQTQARMIAGKRRTHADALRFCKAALSGGDKLAFLASVRAAFPELY